MISSLNLNVKPKYCPNSITRYYRRPDYKTGTKKNLSELQDDVRAHLSSIGWKFWAKLKQGREEWRYDSPNTKKTYYSLRSVCKAILEGKEILVEDYVGPLGGALMAFSGEDCGGGSSENSAPAAVKTVAIGKRKRKKEEVERVVKRRSFRVLRSSKTVHVEPSGLYQVPRTILSWLIENNAVLAREKVQYIREKDDKPMGEGRITNSGINCSCCAEVYTLSGFKGHVSCNNNFQSPSANLFFCKDGNSLVQRQLDVMHQRVRNFIREPVYRNCGKGNKSSNDHICSFCQYGGQLLLCDGCPLSFHAECLELQEIPEGDWFCPSCCCEICKKESHLSKADKNMLSCHQCERQYHADCVRNRNMVKLDPHSSDNWFCSKTCEKVHWGLQQLLGKPFLVGHNNLTCTLGKPMDYLASDHDDCDIVAMADNFSKLSVALEVMHECFEPVKEPRTRRDLVEDVIFCKGSDRNRLNYKGFYTVLLERNDELITVAILRVFGDKVAEIPLIGTRFKHRRLGMCRIVMDEIEKNLNQLGVKRLVLPAAKSVLNTWTTAFGFTPVTKSERSEFLSYCFLDFQDTVMCQKLLQNRPSPLPQLWRDTLGVRHLVHRNFKGNSIIPESERNSNISEVSQEDLLEGSVDQGSLVNVTEEKSNCDDTEKDAPVAMLTYPSPPTEPECEPEKSDRKLKFYQRKKAAKLRPPVSRANCPKVQVSCI